MKAPAGGVVDARVRLPVDRRPPDSSPAPALRRQRYDEVLGLNDKVAAGTAEALLEALRDHGIGHAVVHAETEGGEDAAALRAATAQLVAEHPDRLSGVGTITMPPDTPGAGSREVQDCADLGLVGVNVQPAFAGLDLDDRRLYPAYARAEELGLVVALHTGVSYSRVHPMSHERPDLLDRVACDFPDLRLVACHGGWPWVTEFCAVARRHPTVFLEFGGLAPRYVMRPGTGWDALAGTLDTVMREQVLFATDWPVFPHGRALEEWRAAGLRERTLDNLLWRNASAVYGGPGLRR